MDVASLTDDPVRPDPSGNTVALVNLVTEIGPDIAEISRRLGQFKESVRYRYKEKVLKRGLRVKAEVDYDALGLSRIVMKVRVSQTYQPQAARIFDAMSDLCYLVASAGTMPGDTYLIQGAVPKEFVGEYHRFMETLQKRGIFSSIEFLDCDWFRVAPMRADCFNFEEGVWDFDWSNPPPVDERAARAAVSERKEFDEVDLLLLKELSKDADRSLMEARDAIKRINGIDINYKTLGWHYKHHVLGRGLVKGYSVGWHGLKYSFPRERAEGFGKHAHLGVSLIVRETSEKEKMLLRSELNRLPFLWSEAAGSGYYCQLYFPLETVNEALQFLKKVLRPFGKRSEILLLDKEEMASFTIGYRLWDEQKRKWTFDPSVVLPRLEAVALKMG